jgi:signal transduction histidine kinase
MMYSYHESKFPMNDEELVPQLKVLNSQSENLQVGHWKFSLRSKYLFLDDKAALLHNLISGRISLYRLRRLFPDLIKEIFFLLRSLDTKNKNRFEINYVLIDKNKKTIKAVIYKSASNNLLHGTVELASILEVEDQIEEVFEMHTENLSKLQQQYLKDLSHSLRTPLTPVLIGIKRLQMDSRCEAWILKILEVLERNVMLEISLIDELIDGKRLSQEGKTNKHV